MFMTLWDMDLRQGILILKMIKGTFMKKIFILMFAIIAASCATNYVPLPSKKITVSENYALLKTKHYTLIIDYRYWIKEPQNLTDFFTTFYVSIYNNTKQNIIVKPSDFHLVDEDGKQYDIVPIKDIYRIMIPQDDNFNLLTEDKNKNNNNIIEKRQEARRNIMDYSLSYGKIMPGAKKTGYIFFNHLPYKNKKCKIFFKNHTIGFIRLK